jgi:hypothetical protein
MNVPGVGCDAFSFSLGSSDLLCFYLCCLSPPVCRCLSTEGMNSEGFFNSVTLGEHRPLNVLD